MVLYVAGVAATLWHFVYHTDRVPSMPQEHKVIGYTKGDQRRDGLSQWTI